jgi:hypothetical protein
VIWRTLIHIGLWLADWASPAPEPGRCAARITYYGSDDRASAWQDPAPSTVIASRRAA